jgi:hypothetical protein
MVVCIGPGDKRRVSTVESCIYIYIYVWHRIGVGQEGFDICFVQRKLEQGAHGAGTAGMSPRMTREEETR